MTKKEEEIKKQVIKACKLLSKNELEVDDILGKETDKTKFKNTLAAFTQKGQGIEWKLDTAKKVEKLIQHIDAQSKDALAKEALKEKVAAICITTLRTKDKLISDKLQGIINEVTSDSFQGLIDQELRIAPGINKNWKETYEATKGAERKKVNKFIASFVTHTNEAVNKMEQKPDVSWEKRRFDSLARLLNVGTNCASASFDGEDIKISFNEVRPKGKGEIAGFSKKMHEQTKEVMSYLQDYTKSSNPTEFIQNEANKEISQKIIIRGAAYYDEEQRDAGKREKDLVQNRDDHAKYSSHTLASSYSSAITGGSGSYKHGNRYNKEARDKYHNEVDEKDVRAMNRIKADLGKIRSALANDDGDQRFSTDIREAFKQDFDPSKNLVVDGTKSPKFHAEIRQMRYYQRLVKEYKTKSTDPAKSNFKNLANGYFEYLQRESKSPCKKSYNEFKADEKPELTDVSLEEESLIRKINYLQIKGVYVGVAKLCCAQCSLVMNQEDKLALEIEIGSDKRTIDIETVGGSHGKSFIWAAIEDIAKDDNMLRNFLGEEAYKIYDEANDDLKKLYKQIASNNIDKLAEAFVDKEVKQNNSKTIKIIAQESQYALDSDSDVEVGFAEPKYKESLQEQLEKREEDLVKVRQELAESKKKLEAISNFVAGLDLASMPLTYKTAIEEFNKLNPGILPAKRSTPPHLPSTSPTSPGPSSPSVSSPTVPPAKKHKTASSDSSPDLNANLTKTEKASIGSKQNSVQKKGSNYLQDVLEAVNEGEDKALAALAKINIISVIESDVNMKSVDQLPVVKNADQTEKERPNIASVQIVAEDNHLSDHKGNVQKFREQIESGEIGKNNVILLERKEYGDNLGMQDVIKLANIIEHNEQHPDNAIRIPANIKDDWLLYEDAVLYKVAKEAGVRVIGLEGKNLKTEYGTTEHNQAREEYMGQMIERLESKGYEVIANVGSDHEAALKERFNIVDTELKAERSRVEGGEKTKGEQQVDSTKIESAIHNEHRSNADSLDKAASEIKDSADQPISSSKKSKIQGLEEFSAKKAPKDRKKLLSPEQKQEALIRARVQRAQRLSSIDVTPGKLSPSSTPTAPSHARNSSQSKGGIS